LFSPQGRDWPALHDALRAKAHSLQRRSCALQGRVLLANSMVLSKLWYKLRLSSPSSAQLTAFRSIAWDAVWAGHTGLKPGALTGVRPCRYGGVGLLDPTAQMSALQAMWFAKFLTARPTPPWGAALKHFLSTIPGGTSALADTSLVSKSVPFLHAGAHSPKHGSNSHPNGHSN
jgi:hypothetical protein